MRKRVRLYGEVAMLILRLLWIVVKRNPGATYSWVAKFAAEGAFGTWAQRIYLGLIGRKTKIGMIIGLAYFVASIACSAGLHLGCLTVSWIGDASVAMLGWGVIDASARSKCPTENVSVLGSSSGRTRDRVEPG